MYGIPDNTRTADAHGSWWASTCMRMACVGATVCRIGRLKSIGVLVREQTQGPQWVQGIEALVLLSFFSTCDSPVSYLFFFSLGFMWFLSPAPPQILIPSALLFRYRQRGQVEVSRKGDGRRIRGHAGGGGGWRMDRTGQVVQSIGRIERKKEAHRVWLLMSFFSWLAK